MREYLQRAVALAILILGFCQGAGAGGLTVLHHFTGTNGDGGLPTGGVVISGSVLCGTTTSGGGSANTGTVFSINLDGSGFTNLHLFTGPDGAIPAGSLVAGGDMIYGTTSQGGAGGEGTVFALNQDGSGFAVLHGFSGVDGSDPIGGLCLAGGTLYGTTSGGFGNLGSGSVFGVNTDGTGFSTIYGFGPWEEGAWMAYATVADPLGTVVISGDILYGTTFEGPLLSNGAGFEVPGTVFSINTDGSGFDYVCEVPALGGSGPHAGIVVAGETLDGTTFGGDGWGGTVFAVNTDGTGFRVLHTFAGFDGACPVAALVLSGNTLYGTTTLGGGANLGTVFSVNVDGTDFNILHSLSGLDGQSSRGAMV